MKVEAPQATAQPQPRPRRRARRRRRIAMGLTAALLAILISFAALEVLVRVLNHWDLVHTGAWQKRDGIRFKVRGGEGLNSEGFRDLERSFAKPAGTYRIVMLGDSYIWGTVPYAQNFPTLVEARLNADLKPAPPPAPQKIEIINLGVPGYGPQESLEMLRAYGVKFHPDAVIYGLYYGNDLTDNGPDHYDLSILGERVQIHTHSLADRSRLLDYLRVKWNEARAASSAPLVAADPAADSPTALAADRYTAQELFDPRGDRALASHAAFVGGILQAMRDFAGQQRVPFFVIRYPSQVMVDPHLAVGLRARYAADDPLRGRPGDATLDLTRPVRAMDKILGGLHIAGADITPAIAAAQGRDGANLYGGMHWNADGNRIAAAAMTPAIEDFLTSHGLQFHRRDPGAGK